MSNGAQKNYLFVSNQCPHSRQILNQIRNTQLATTLNVINIDDPRIQIPNFIQCVPTLYLPTKRQVLTEKHLIQYFQSAMQEEQQNKNKISIADITGDASILPFQINEMGSGLSGAAYAFIEDDKNDLMNQNYSFLQDRDINKLPDFTRHDSTPSSSMSSNSLSGGMDGGMGGGSGGNMGAGNQQRKTGGETESKYQEMMNSRGAEMKNRAPPPTPDFSSPMF